MLDEPAVPWALLAILGNHLYSLIANFIARGAWRAAQHVLMFGEPLRHIVVLHVGIALGGIVLLLFASPLIAATVLLVAKTVSDLRSLVLERKAG